MFVKTFYMKFFCTWPWMQFTAMLGRYTTSQVHWSAIHMHSDTHNTTMWRYKWARHFSDLIYEYKCGLKSWKQLQLQNLHIHWNTCQFQLQRKYESSTYTKCIIYLFKYLKTQKDSHRLIFVILYSVLFKHVLTITQSLNNYHLKQND